MTVISSYSVNLSEVDLSTSFIVSGDTVDSLIEAAARHLQGQSLQSNLQDRGEWKIVKIDSCPTEADTYKMWATVKAVFVANVQ